MSRELYTALSGAVAHGRALDIVAENVANASTSGYRAQRSTFQKVMGETDMVHALEPSPLPGRGAITETGNPLDLAVESDGWFVLEGGDGPRLTRAGAFHLDPEGRVVNRDGLMVLGDNGEPLEIPPTTKQVAVGNDGVVSADAEVVGKVWIARVADADLVANGGPFRLRQGAALATDTEAHVRSGALEGSSVQVVREMVDLIQGSRLYEAATKAVQTIADLEHRTARGGR